MQMSRNPPCDTKDTLFKFGNGQWFIRHECRNCGRIVNQTKDNQPEILVSLEQPCSVIIDNEPFLHL